MQQLESRDLIKPDEVWVYSSYEKAQKQVGRFQLGVIEQVYQDKAITKTELEQAQKFLKANEFKKLSELYLAIGGDQLVAHIIEKTIS